MTRKSNWGVYAYFDKKTGDCIYIGIAKDLDASDERHRNHLKPAKYNIQKINAYLQDNPNTWEYVVIWDKINAPEFVDEETRKKMVHAVESVLIDTYNPSINDYKTKGES